MIKMWYEFRYFCVKYKMRYCPIVPVWSFSMLIDTDLMIMLQKKIVCYMTFLS